MDNLLITEDLPENGAPCNAKEEAASFAIALMRAAKHFNTADRIVFLDGVCSELSDAREKLAAQAA